MALASRAEVAKLHPAPVRPLPLWCSRLLAAQATIQAAKHVGTSGRGRSWGSGIDQVFGSSSSMPREPPSPVRISPAWWGQGMVRARVKGATTATTMSSMATTEHYQTRQCGEGAAR